MSYFTTISRFLFALILFLGFALGQSAFGQTSAGSGAWNVAGTWVGGIVPGAGATVTIATGHTVTISNTTDLNTLNDVIVQGTLTISSGSINPFFNVTVDAGGIVNVDAGGFLLFSGTATIIGTYNHNRDGSDLPFATWGATSNCNVTGITTTSFTMTSLGQTFGNFTWNCPTQTATIGTGTGIAMTVAGNFTVSNTGTGNLTFARPLNVAGNFTNSVGTINLNLDAATTTFNGGAIQTISGGSGVRFWELVINQSPASIVDVTSSNLIILNALTLTEGRVRLNNTDLSFAGASGYITRYNGWVETNGTGINGFFVYSTGSAATNVLFPVGSDTQYQPISIADVPTNGAIVRFGTPTITVPNSGVGSWTVRTFSGTSEVSILNPQGGTLGASSKIHINNAGTWTTVPTTYSSPDYISSGIATTGSIDEFSVFTPLTPVISIADGGFVNEDIYKTVKQKIYTLQISATAPTSLTSLSIPTNGSYVASDIDNFKLYHNTVNDFATATPLSTAGASTGAGETISFTSFSEALSGGIPEYFYLVADISTGAATGNTISTPFSFPFTNFGFSNTVTDGGSSYGSSGIKTIQPAALPTQPLGNRGLYFDGVDDYVDTPLIPVTNSTIEFWFKSNLLNNGQPLVSSLQSAGTDGLSVELASTNEIRFSVGANGARDLLLASVPIEVNKWYHVACSFNGSTTRIYINGTLEATGASGRSINGVLPYRIGRHPYGGPNHLSGQIDEIRVFNTVRTQAQIQTDMGSTTANGAVGYWNFEEGTGTTANDLGSSSSNGILTNNPLWALRVKNTNDSGIESLRAAIAEANTFVGTNYIDFSIQQTNASAVSTITLASNLPAISETAVLDAYSAYGSSPNTGVFGAANNAQLRVEINANGYPNALDALNNVIIKGFALYGTNIGTNSGGILLEGIGNHVEGCFVGLQANGTLGSPVNATAGIKILGANNTVGWETTLDVAKFNVISGNTTFDGIELFTNTNTVQGNYIGTDPTGTTAIANGLRGISVNADGNLILNNVISGNNSGFGIGLFNTSAGNIIRGNRIGTTADGTGPLGNLDGIGSGSTANNNTIGGTGVGQGNTIAYNTSWGVFINGLTYENKISANNIYNNGSAGIFLAAGGNANKAVPVVSSATNALISGTCEAGDVVEVFNDTPQSGATDQGRTFLGTASVVGTNWTYSGTFANGDRFTATATSATNNTSPFAVAAVVAVPVLPTQPAGNRGLYFDGVDDKVVTNTFSLTDFTIEFWIKTKQTGLAIANWYDGYPILDADVAGCTNDYGIGLANGKIVFGVGSSSCIGGEQTIATNTTVNDGAWHHISAIRNTTTNVLIIYVDGALDTSAPTTIISTVSGFPLTFGASTGGSSQHFNGQLDEVRVFNTARTLAQVQTDMGTTTPNGAVGYWNFDEGTGQTVNDISGNGNNGNLGVSFAVDSADPLWALRVKNTNPNGVESFRDVIDEANTLSGKNYIDFSIPTTDANYSAGVWTVQSFTGIPNSVTEEAIIDGYSAFGAVPATIGTPATIAIQIAAPSTSNTNLQLNSTSSVTVRGLSLAQSVSSGLAALWLSGTAGHLIEGNHIGVNATGIASYPTSRSGALVIQNSSNNTIGGTSPAQRNVISGALRGIRIDGATSNNNTILGNYIGVQADGISALGNNSVGIIINGSTSAQNNTIGNGLASGANIIANTTGVGVNINNNVSINNRISHNYIYNNTLSGISLTGGGNANKAIPIISSATLSLISGTCEAGDVVEVFNDTPQSGTTNQGRTYLGPAAVVGTNWTYTGSFTNGDRITATATSAANNTSPFAVAAIVTAPVVPTQPLGNRGMYFDGVDDYVNVNTHPISNDFTISFWIKTNQTGTPIGTAYWQEGYGLIDNECVCGNGDFGLSLANGKILFGAADGGTDYTDQSNATVNDNKWHHIAMVRTQATGAVELYIDGVLDKLVTHSTITYGVNQGLQFGKIRSSTNYFNGQLDEIRIFNTVRTPAQIATDMGTQTANGAAAYWNLDESTGTTANDIVSGYNGTLATSPANPLWALQTTNILDDGSVGSLRWAINEANTDTDTDYIDFSIQQADATITGKRVINIPATALTVSESIVIDGYSAYGASPNTLAVGNDAQLRIELNFTGNPQSEGLLLNNTSNSLVKGLSMYGLTNSGAVFKITGGVLSNNNKVEGNWFGLGVAGNAAGQNVNGIQFYASNNTIGGTTPASRNVISNSIYNAVFLEGNTNIVQGNYIGTDPTGTTARTNGDRGVLFTIVSSGNSILNNVISGNGLSGIDLRDNTFSNIVKGNLIGTRADGTGSIPNAEHGILIDNVSINNIIGGTSAGEENTIANNSNWGILVNGGSAVGNTFSGNKIFGNASGGISLVGGGNANKAVPVIISATPTLISGTCESGDIIEIFNDTPQSGTTDQGRTYLGIASVSGTNWTRLGGFTNGDRITATARSAANNTSPFSVAAVVASPLSITTLNPISNALNIANNSTIQTNFSANIPVADNTKIKVIGSQTGYKTGAFTGAGTSNIVFAPTLNFKAGETITVEYLTSLLGAGGEVLSSPQQYQFTAAAAVASANFVLNTIPTGTNPTAICSFDADGDNDIDMAVACSDLGNTIYWINVFINNGSGTFTNPSYYNISATAQPSAIVAFDANGDGKMDLATSNRVDNNVSVLLGNGDGTFQSAVNYSLTGGTSPKFICVFDADGDGDMDLSTANSGTNNVSVLLNNGSGTYAASVEYASSGTSPMSISSFDADGDGDMDLAVGHLIGGVTILKNNGSAAFTYSSTPTSGGSNYSATVFDANADGKIDLAVSVGNSANLAVLSNDGTGTFALANNNTVGSGPRAIASFDADGDGDLDLAVANENVNNLSILQNNAGTFSLLSTTTVGTNPSSITSFDADGDGDMDLVVANAADGTLSVLFNASTAPKITSFTPTSGIVGTSVTITGLNFNATFGNNTVYFGAVKAIPTAGSTTSLTVTVPAGATSVTPIVVQDNANGLQASSMETITGTTVRQFTVTNTPTLTPNYVRTDFVVGGGSAGIVLKDFNGDGFADIATANPNADNVSVILGNGTGGFGAATNYAVGDEPFHGVASGDFNNDGNLDLAVPNYGISNNVSVLLGTGTGTFGAATNFAVGTKPAHIAIGDFNDDGNLDLVTANNTSDNVSILLGTGTGTFGVATNFTTQTGPWHVAVGDFNNDGNTDLAVSTLTSSGVSILLGNGAGSFGAFTDFAVGIGPRAVEVGDFNNDGNLDLATANYNVASASVILGTGTGSFGAPTTLTIGGSSSPQKVRVGDFNGDGNRDVVVSSYFTNLVSMFLGDGTGGFGTVTNFSVGAAPVGLEVADVNGDGKTDIIVANELSNSVSVLLYAAPPIITSFAPTSGVVGTTVTITGLNFNATPANNSVYFGAIKVTPTAGNATSLTVTVPAGATSITPIVVQDNITGLQGSSMETITGVGTRQFRVTNTPTITPNYVKTDYATGLFSRSIAVGDFNGDGNNDMAVANAGLNNLSVLLGTGIGSFGTANNFATGTGPGGIASGDFNKDGILDLVTVNNQSHNVSILLGTGTGNFGTAANFPVGLFPISVAVGDFNKDGVLDLATADNFANTVSILLGDGTGSFGTATNFGSGVSPYLVIVGDFNGDGIADLVTANNNSNNVSILLGTGTGSFGMATNFATGTGAMSVAIGDFNGDGSSDLAVANQTSNNVSILLGTGTGSFGIATNFNVGTTPRSVVVGDFDGDGYVDLAVGNYGSDNVSILLGTGTGNFGSVINSNVGTAPQSVSVGDFNGDGKADLATANYSSNNVSVLLYGFLPPTALAATAVTTTSFTANWTTTTGNYEIDITNDPTFTTFTTVTSTTNSFGFTGLTAGTTYYYRVRNFGEVVNSSIRTVFLPPTRGAGRALDLTAANTYVQADKFDNTFGSAEFTIEAWIKDGGGVLDRTIAHSSALTTVLGQHNYWRFYTSSGDLHIDLGSGGSGVTQATSGTPVPAGQWTHVAVTRDASNNVTFYVNGIPYLGGNTNVDASNGGTLRIGAIRGAIGTPSANPNDTPNDRFVGEIDEVRIWNTALTQGNIRNNMCQKLVGSEANLLGYFRFDEAAGNTTENRATGSQFEGTLFNTPTRVNSGAALGDISTHRYTTAGTASLPDFSAFFATGGISRGVQVYKINESPNSITVNPSVINTLEASQYFGVFGVNIPSFNVTYNYTSNTNINGQVYEPKARLYSRSDGAATAWGGTSSTINTVTKTITLAGQNTSEFIAGVRSFVSVLQPGSGKALSFNGTNQYVDLGTGLGLAGGGFTMEAWVKIPTNSFTHQNTILGKNINLTTTSYRFNIDNAGRLGLWVGDGMTSSAFLAPTPITPNQWTHVAAVYDNSMATLTLYINGNVGNSTGTSITGLVSSPFPTLIGSLNLALANYFEGEIDEVRIWNVVRTQTELRDNMCQKIATPLLLPNLLGYYKLDEGTGTVTEDRASAFGDGTLVNAPTWVTSGAALGDISGHQYDAGTLSFVNDGDSFFANLGSITFGQGVHVYKVREAPNSVTLPAGIAAFESTRYFGVYKVNVPSVDITYQYNTNTNINGTVQEYSAVYSERDDNAASAWSIPLPTNFGMTPPTNKYLTLSTPITSVQKELIVGFTSVAPAIQATNIIFSALTSSSVGLQWTNGSGTDRIVVARTDNNFTPPTNGIAYNVGDLIGGGTVVYNGTGSSFTANGLTPKTKYFFFVYEYSIVSLNPVYNIQPALNNPLSISTIAGVPANQPTNPVINPTPTVLTGSFSPAVPAVDGYIGMIRRPNDNPVPPVDGTTYDIGTQFFSSQTVAFVGNITTFEITGLEPATEYVLEIYAYNGSGETIAYKNDKPLTIKFTTPALSPVLTSIDPKQKDVGDKSFTLRAIGKNFIPKTVLQWQGQALTTTFVSKTELTAEVENIRLLDAGTYAITASTPEPGGGVSNSLPFTVIPVVTIKTIPLVSKIVAPDKDNHLLYRLEFLSNGGETTIKQIKLPLSGSYQLTDLKNTAFTLYYSTDESLDGSDRNVGTLVATASEQSLTFDLSTVANAITPNGVRLPKNKLAYLLLAVNIAKDATQGREIKVNSIKFDDIEFEGVVTKQGLNPTEAGIAQKIAASTPAVLDYSALIKFFEEMGGKKWTTPWNLNNPVNTWQGVELDENGNVIAISLPNNNLEGKLSDAIMIDGVLISKTLRYLNLSGNKIDGQIPTTIGNLIGLEYLDLSNNGISGNLPDQIGNLTNLITLWVGYNQLTGIGIDFSKLTALRNLSLPHNNLASLPDNLFNLKQLEVLDLRGNKLKTLPSSFVELKKLTYLDISNNELVNMPQGISGMTDLEIFFAHDNFFASLPPSLVNLSKLLQFTIEDNLLTFASLEPLRAWWTAGQSKTNVIYAPQGKIGLPQEIIAQIGEPITLKIATSGSENRYQWLRNGIAIQGAVGASYLIPAMSASLSGIYTVNVSSSLVPNLILQSYNIILLPDCSKLSSKPSISVNGSLSFCGTEIVNTNLYTAVSSNIVSYKWYLNGIELTGSDISSIFAKDAGRYRVQIQTKDGCSLLSDDLGIFLFPEYFVNISKNQETLIAQSTDRQLVAFEWLLGSTVISGANQQSYVPQEKGDYRVRVTDINGCRATSQPINVGSVTAVEDKLYEGQIGIYPNPSQGIFYIETGSEKVTKIEVFNAVGQYLNTQISQISPDKYMIDLKNQSLGLYFIQLTTQKGNIIRKIVRE